jgi:hypothetical protein
MVNPNLDNANTGNDDTPLFKTGQWNPISLAEWIARHAPDDYAAWGGNPDLYAGSAQDTPTGPQEYDQAQDALIVAHYLVDHPVDALAEMKKLNLQWPHAPNFIGDPNSFIPLWTPAQDQQAVDDGLRGGASVEDATQFLLSIGYTARTAADILNGILADYNSCIGSQPVSRFIVGAMQPPFICDWKSGLLGDPEIEQFIDPRSGYIVSQITWNAYAIGYGAAHCWVPYDTATCLAEGQQLLQKFPQYPWVQLIKRQMNPANGIFAKYTGGAVGYEYLLNSYRWRYGNPRDSTDALLALTSDFITRFVAVPIEGQLLTAKAVAAAKANKIVYGLWDMVSNIPIDPVGKKTLKNGQYYNPAGHFPTMLQSYLITGYNGFNPMGLAGEPGVQTVYTADWINGQPKTSVVGVQQNFDTAVQDILRSRIAFWTVAGGYRLMNMGYSGANDAKGNHVPTKFGVLIAYVKQPDKTRAFPYFEDNNQYGDLAAALKAGLTTDVELANTFEGGLTDPALYQLLGAQRGSPGSHNAIASDLVNQDVAADFYSNPNMVTLKEAWLRVTPKLLPSTTS